MAYNGRFLAACLAMSALHACHTEKKPFRTEFHEPLGPRWTIDVTRLDVFAESVGSVTGHHYGSSHHFSYEFVLNPGRHAWLGFDGQVPELLTICQGQEAPQLYLRYSQREVVVPADPHDAPTEKITVQHHRRYHDARWFFGRLGAQRWQAIGADEVPVQSADCEQHLIPVRGESATDATDPQAKPSP